MSLIATETLISMYSRLGHCPLLKGNYNYYNIIIIIVIISSSTIFLCETHRLQKQVGLGLVVRSETRAVIYTQNMVLNKVPGTKSHPGSFFCVSDSVCAGNRLPIDFNC